MCGNLGGTWVLTLALPLTSCVALSKGVNLSETPFFSSVKWEEVLCISHTFGPSRQPLLACGTCLAPALDLAEKTARRHGKTDQGRSLVRDSGPRFQLQGWGRCSYLPKLSAFTCEMGTATLSSQGCSGGKWEAV